MVEITKEDLTKLEENLGRVIAKGFDENTEQHRKILEVLEKPFSNEEKILKLESREPRTRTSSVRGKLRNHYVRSRR